MTDKNTFMLTHEELTDIIINAVEHGSIAATNPKRDTQDAITFGYCARMIEELNSKHARGTFTLPQPKDADLLLTKRDLGILEAALISWDDQIVITEQEQNLFTKIFNLIRK